jgi:uncharacterized C2H2 Zn-finger protein
LQIDFPFACLLTEHQKQHQHGKFAARKVEEIKCSRCSKTFKTRTRFLIHLRKVHKAKEARKCQICLVTFGTAERLKAHLENHEIVETFNVLNACATQKRNSVKSHVKRRQGNELFEFEIQLTIIFLQNDE